GLVGHVVAQVVKTKLGVGAVSDVLAVHFAALDGVHRILDAADREPEIVVHEAHPFGVAAGEVVVDGDNVHALAGETVEVGGRDGDEGFAFAGGHFRDAALMQGNAADHLHVVGDFHPGAQVAADVV